MSGTNAAAINSCEKKIQFLNPNFLLRKVSTSGAHKNLNTQGSTNKAVMEVILATSTFISRRIAGSAHHIKPIGAPSLK